MMRPTWATFLVAVVVGQVRLAASETSISAAIRADADDVADADAHAAVGICLSRDDCQRSFQSGLVEHPGDGNWTAGYFKIYNMTGNWGTKGCYGYIKGQYAGHYFFGTGGTESQMSAPVTNTKETFRAECNFNTSSPSEAIESCTDSQDCEDTFTSGVVPHPKGGNWTWTAGYHTTNLTYNFTGNYGTKGCYGYLYGRYAGHYFFGTNGTPAQMTSLLSGSAFRTDCNKVTTTILPPTATAPTIVPFTTSTTTLPVPTTSDNYDCQEHCINLFKKKKRLYFWYRNVNDQDLAKTFCSRNQQNCKDEWGCERRSVGAKEILCSVGKTDCSVCKAYLNA